MPRHRRHVELRAAELEALTDAAAVFSRELQQHMCNLKPGGQQYKQVSDLHDKVCESVKAITGDPPKWRRGW